MLGCSHSTPAAATPMVRGPKKQCLPGSGLTDCIFKFILNFQWLWSPYLSCLLPSSPKASLHSETWETSQASTEAEGPMRSPALTHLLSEPPHLLCAPHTQGYSTNVFCFLSSVPGARWHSLRFIIIVFHNLKNVSPLKASAPCWFSKLTLT